MMRTQKGMAESMLGLRHRLDMGLGVALALFVAACATAPQPFERAGDTGQIEAIHAAAFTRDTILLKVSSNGCTGKDDIKPFITKLKSHAVMSFHRLEEDTCKAKNPDGVQLQWSFDELGLEPGTSVEVTNPYRLPRDAS